MQCVWVVKNRHFVFSVRGTLRSQPIDVVQAINYGREIWWVDSRFSKDTRQRRNIIPVRDPLHQRRFNWSSTSTHKRVIDYISGFGQSFNKVSGKLRFEACPVRNFMYPRRLSLSSGPKLSGDVFACWNHQFTKSCQLIPLSLADTKSSIFSLFPPAILTGHPPTYDISIFGIAEVCSDRISE